MIASMEPVLDDAEYVFCSFTGGTAVETALACALASFAEDEGPSLVLRMEDAQAMGLDTEPAMRRITLSVYSPLAGVGLTAAVSGRLSDAGIACNVIAAYHHDHLFIPVGDADRAMQLLQELQAEARSARS